MAANNEITRGPYAHQKRSKKRVEETRKASPVLKQKEAILKQRNKLSQSMDKLLDAYQEGLITIGQLRIRMPELQKRLGATERSWRI